jgi:hypothetical protein
MGKTRKRQKLEGIAFEAQSLSPQADCRGLQGWYDAIPGPNASGPDLFRQCRQFASSNDFARFVVFIKRLLFNDGLAIKGTKTPEQLAELTRVTGDIWTEWLTCDNAVVAWVTPPTANFPALTVPDCECVKYSNVFGAESLSLRLPSQNLSQSQKEKLGTRYAEAIAGGRELEWGDDPGEDFSVLLSGALYPGGKLGSGGGLGKPSMFSAFDALATLTLLGIGDKAAAWIGKDVIRHISKGHEVKDGALAGRPVYYLSAKEKKIIHDEMKKHSGGFDVVSNFDVKIGFAHIDPAFFDAAKYRGTLDRLFRWSGPVGQLFFSHQSSAQEEQAQLLHMLRAEGEAHRAAIAGFVSGIAARCGAPGVTLEWSKATFMSWDTLLRVLNAATSSGLMSYQTGREWLGLDDGTESGRNAAAAKNRAGYTPPFEQKQGIVSEEIHPAGGKGAGA